MTKFLCGECIHNSDKGGGCLIPKNLGYVDNCNRYLPKDRPIVQTNEEYLRSCDTEELTNWLVDEIKNMASSFLCKEFSNKDCKVLHGYYCEWLKEIHHG